jgi:hypothetical protein
MKLHPENSKSLDLIEKSLYAIALDEFETPTIEEAVQIALFKNSKNRFFDKAYTLWISKNGFSSSNTEHSAYDGICSATISNYIAVETAKLKLKYSQVDSFQKRISISEPVELNFHYDTKIGAEIKKSVDIFEKHSSNLDLKILTLSNCDKNTLKSYKINPGNLFKIIFDLLT